MNQVAEAIHGHISIDVLSDDGQFPNNQKLPLLVYKGVLHLHPDDEATAIIALFKKNNWTNSWKNGILHEHHYHSTTHEVLGVFCGKADVHVGGPEGVCVELVRGDVIIIPVGVAHKCTEASRDFVCIGAYPEGRQYDMNYGKEGERPGVDENISKVPLPEKDPVFGDKGPLKENWKVK